MLQALIELAFSVIGIAIVLRTSRSFGAYAQRIERSNEITRQVVESAVQRIDRRRDEAERVLQSVRRLRQDLHGSDELSSPSSSPSPSSERSA